MRERHRPTLSTTILLALVSTGVACAARDGAAPPSADQAPDASADAGAPSPSTTTTSLPTPPPRPSATDGVKNGSETDVDCGGPDVATPRCKLYATCDATSDCAAGTCTPGPSGKRCQLAPSCTGAPGTQTCGLNADEDCCVSLPVPTGTFDRRMNGASLPEPTKVSAYRLDKFEITVGRLRAWFTSAGGNPKAHAPAPGAGAHPRFANSGWRSSFAVRLPASWTEINDRLGANGCTVGGDNSDGGAATWTPLAGANEDLPVNCLDWYTLFAFCAWDGGRIPTDAEWLYAAQGGNEQRWYAWGGPGDSRERTWPADNDFVVASLRDPSDEQYKFTVGTPFRATDPLTGKVIDGPAHIAPAGRKKGHARWGHADLTGSVLELLLDNAPIAEGPCAEDCAKVDWPDPPQDQVGWYPPAWWTGPEDAPVYPDGYRPLRGGSWDPTHPLYAWFQYVYRVQRTYSSAGGRCARD